MVLGLVLAVSACNNSGIGGLLGGKSGSNQRNAVTDDFGAPIERRTSTFADLLTNKDDPNTTVEVNKYLWKASLEILNFLPIESVDPFTGVIVTGFGTPPGGGRAYRATIYVQDPALDARSLTVALASSGGAVPVETVRAIEDAILTRARQLRIAESRL